MAHPAARYLPRGVTIANVAQTVIVVNAAYQTTHVIVAVNITGSMAATYIAAKLSADQSSIIGIVSIAGNIAFGVAICYRTVVVLSK